MEISIARWLTQEYGPGNLAERGVDLEPGPCNNAIDISLVQISERQSFLRFSLDERNGQGMKHYLDMDDGFRSV
jgi:hypothetical protein